METHRSSVQLHRLTVAVTAGALWFTHSPIHRYQLRRTRHSWARWRRQLWGTAARTPSTSNNFIFSSLWSKSDSQLSKHCVVCKISWCRCQQLTALSISTAVSTKLLVIEQLLQPALKFAVSAHDHIYSSDPPRNKSWRPHWLGVFPSYCTADWELCQRSCHLFSENLFGKRCTKFHQNRPSFIEDITKKHFGLFFSGHTVDSRETLFALKSWRHC